MKHEWEKSGRRMGEYWNNLYFWHFESRFFASVFGSKKHLFRHALFLNPFSKSPKMKKTPALCPFVGNTFFRNLISALQTSPPNPDRAKRHPSHPFSRPNTHEIRTHSPPSPHHSPLLAVRKCTHRCLLFKPRNTKRVTRRCGGLFVFMSQIGLLLGSFGN